MNPLTNRGGSKKVFIITGEPSGDIQAGLLVSQLKALDTSVRVFAVGGESLKAAGAEIIHNIKDLSVLGFFDVLKHLDKFKKLMQSVLDKIEEIKPDAVIFVDFSGFNLRLAKKIHTLTKTIYYISPQVWASRQGRVKTIKECIDKMIVIFKFERDFYQRFGIDAEFVGHPLLDIVKPSAPKETLRKEFGLKPDTLVLALLPGSRISEVTHILPIMLESVKLIKEKIPHTESIIAKSRNIALSMYEGLTRKTSIGAKIIEGRQYDCLEAADFVLVASGTATLEAAIMRKPNVIIYKMGLLNYLLYRPLVKIPFIGMENIVAEKCIAPEFIQFKAKPEAIAKKVLEILRDTQRLEELKKDFAALRERLGEPDAPLRAAKSIFTFINS